MADFQFILEVALEVSGSCHICRICIQLFILPELTPQDFDRKLIRSELSLRFSAFAQYGSCVWQCVCELIRRIDSSAGLCYTQQLRKHQKGGKRRSITFHTQRMTPASLCPTPCAPYILRFCALCGSMRSSVASSSSESLNAKRSKGG